MSPTISSRVISSLEAADRKLKSTKRRVVGYGLATSAVAMAGCVVANVHQSKLIALYSSVIAVGLFLATWMFGTLADVDLASGLNTWKFRRSSKTQSNAISCLRYLRKHAVSWNGR